MSSIDLPDVERDEHAISPQGEEREQEDTREPRAPSASEAQEGAGATRLADGRERKLFGGLTPSEAARRRNAQARERREQREAEAELDKLTVQARFSVALARKLPYAELERVVGALLTKAQEGHVQAAKLLLDYVRVLRGSSDDQPEDAIDLENATPAQRAAIRARILADIAARDEDAAQG